MSDDNQINPFDSEAKPSLAGILIGDTLYALLMGSIIIPIGVAPPLLVVHYFPGVSQLALGAIMLLSIATGVIIALLIVRYIKKSLPSNRPPSA